MCKIDDLIRNTADYLSFMLKEDVCIEPVDRQCSASVPISVTASFLLYRGILLGQDILFAFARNDNTMTPVQIKKYLTLLEKRCNCHAVFVASGIASYNIGRLVEHRVDFIVPGKQIFIPSMLIELKRVKTNNADIRERIPAFAQCILLYHIQKASLAGKEPEDLSNAFNVSYSTVNRALRWLKLHELISLEGSKRKKIVFRYSNKELWEKALPLLASPVEKVVYSDCELKNAKESGINALSEYTVINGEESHVYAVGKDEIKEKEIAIDANWGMNRIEIWRYSPGILSEGPNVDRLSLFLSLKEEKDDRIQIELDDLIKGMKW